MHKDCPNLQGHSKIKVYQPTPKQIRQLHSILPLLKNKIKTPTLTTRNASFRPRASCTTQLGFARKQKPRKKKNWAITMIPKKTFYYAITMPIFAKQKGPRFRKAKKKSSVKQNTRRRLSPNEATLRSFSARVQRCLTFRPGHAIETFPDQVLGMQPFFQ